MKFRPQFHLWHLLALTTLVCVVCAFPILLGPVLFTFVTATVAVGAVRLLTLRQLTIVLWIAAAIVVPFAVMVGVHIARDIERQNTESIEQQQMIDTYLEKEEWNRRAMQLH